MKTTPDYGVAQTHLSSGDGGQLIASLERLPPGTAPEPRGLPAAVRVSGIEHTGEYTGVLSLDPTNEDAAALDVTVKARHFIMWPLLSVYVGALVAWVGGRAYDQTRRGHVVRRVKLKPLDVVVYCGALAFGAVAFLLPVYTATNFGTWEQYLSVFVAGIVGKVVVDQAFTPLEPVVAPAAGDTPPRLPLLRSARHRERHLEPGRSKTALRVGSGSGVAADENASRERHPQQREGASTASRSWCIAPTWFARVPPLPPRERKASVSAPVPETPAWDEHRARGAGVI